MSIQTSAGLIFKSLPDGKKPPTSGLFKHTDVLPSAFMGTKTATLSQLMQEEGGVYTNQQLFGRRFQPHIGVLSENQQVSKRNTVKWTPNWKHTDGRRDQGPGTFWPSRWWESVKMKVGGGCSLRWWWGLRWMHVIHASPLRKTHCGWTSGKDGGVGGSSGAVQSVPNTQREGASLWGKRTDVLYETNSRGRDRRTRSEGEIGGRDRRRFRLVNGRSRCSFSVDARINEACWKEKKTLTFKDP